MSRERLRGTCGLIPETVQNRQRRIFLEARVPETEPALIENRPSIRTNGANMTTTFTKPKVSLKVFDHEVSLARVGRDFEHAPGRAGILKLR
jgi:hypothetical protein